MVIRGYCGPDTEGYRLILGHSQPSPFHFGRSETLRVCARKGVGTNPARPPYLYLAEENYERRTMGSRLKNRKA